MTDWLMIAFTAFVAVFTGFLTWITFRISKHTVASERAYVKMSHKPPGVIIDDLPLNPLEVTVEVKNLGKTPADVSEVYLTYSILPQEETLPAVPEYRQKGQPQNRAFLATNDEFLHRVRFRVSKDELDGVG